MTDIGASELRSPLEVAAALSLQHPANLISISLSAQLLLTPFHRQSEGRLSNMRAVLVGVGITFLAVGSVWILQGSGVLKGSFMTGERAWLWIGIVCVLIGLPVLARGLRPRRP
jgi:hypothetical protein